MDKQIIIDGCDVSGCHYLIKESIYDYCKGEYSMLIGQCTCSDNEMCKYNPQCSYKKIVKQLKRAEQKLDKIKEIVNRHKQNECITCSEFDKCLRHPYCDEVILKIIKE